MFFFGGGEGRGEGRGDCGVISLDVFGGEMICYFTCYDCARGSENGSKSKRRKANQPLPQSLEKYHEYQHKNRKAKTKTSTDTDTETQNAYSEHSDVGGELE